MNKGSNQGASCKDLKKFIERAWRASVSSFLALRKLINAFAFFTRDSRKEGPHKCIRLRPRIN